MQPSASRLTQPTLELLPSLPQSDQYQPPSYVDPQDLILRTPVSVPNASFQQNPSFDPSALSSSQTADAEIPWVSLDIECDYPQPTDFIENPPSQPIIGSFDSTGESWNPDPCYPTAGDSTQTFFQSMAPDADPFTAQPSDLQDFNFMVSAPVSPIRHDPGPIPFDVSPQSSTHTEPPMDFPFAATIAPALCPPSPNSREPVPKPKRYHNNKNTKTKPLISLACPKCPKIFTQNCKYK